MVNTTQRRILRFSYEFWGWFSVSGDPDTKFQADRLVARGLLLRHPETGQYRAPRNVITVLNRIHRAYANDPRGVYVETVSQGWRDAMARVGAIV